MKTTAQALALVLASTLLSLPLLATAAPRAAHTSMQVSFIVKEACSVQNDAAAAVTVAAATSARPSVACQFHTPYQLSRGADQAAAAVNATVNAVSTDSGNAIRSSTSAQDWTLTF